ncbi:MAG: sporulation initiation factor Spo0A C-terminal domain-containing protein [Eubacteriales bacterium]|nr:sporulation initiation factor Spo0A C-terminal domain-containing protein [Eubacteriales bacterium]
MGYFDDEAIKSLGFFVAGSNSELLDRINQLLGDKGHLGICDPQGHYHYVIDGRKGAPFATRKIEGVAQKFLQDSERKRSEEKFNAEFYVDTVLSCYAFDESLKGFHFLRYILIQITLDQGLSTSLSKMLYPMTAEHFQVAVSQVERNVRYCLLKLRELEDQNTKFKHRMLPLTVRDGKAIFQAVKTRNLIEGKSHYTNSEAVRVLSAEIQKMIKRDLFPDLEEEEGADNS